MKNSWFIVKENYKKYWAGSGETTSGEEEREGERKEEKRIIEVKKNGNAERPNNETKGVWEAEEKKSGINPLKTTFVMFKHGKWKKKKTKIVFS